MTWIVFDKDYLVNNQNGMSIEIIKDLHQQPYRVIVNTPGKERCDVKRFNTYEEARKLFIEFVTE